METRRLLWVMPLPSHNKTPGRFQRILVSLSLTLCLCSYKHLLPSPLHAKSVVPHHLIWESDEWKIHRYCDLDNLFQNVSNSPQGSSGMKQNRRQPTQQTQPHGVESGDSCTRTDALSNLLIFKLKVFGSWQSTTFIYSSSKVLKLEHSRWSAWNARIWLQFKHSKQGKKKQCWKAFFEPLTATVVTPQKACQ